MIAMGIVVRTPAGMAKSRPRVLVEGSSRPSIIHVSFKLPHPTVEPRSCLVKLNRNHFPDDSIPARSIGSPHKGDSPVFPRHRDPRELAHPQPVADFLQGIWIFLDLVSEFEVDDDSVCSVDINHSGTDRSRGYVEIKLFLYE